MKKLLFIFLLVLFAVACSDLNEDIIPDPVSPEIEEVAAEPLSGEGTSGAKKPRN